ncbi:MAG: ATPase [Methylococcales bacterium]|nr:ATPase [Methylococcales bacterium]
MSIVRLKKLTFCGLSVDKTEVLTALQALGGAHLIAADTVSELPQPTRSTDEQRACKALKYLSQHPNRRHQQHDDKNFDFDGIINRTLDIQLATRQLSDKRDALLKRIKEVEPWGNFSLPENEQLAGLRLWFYIVPKKMMPKIQAVDLVWQVVWKDNLHDYVVVIDSQEPAASSMPVARTHTGHVPLATLKSELEQVELALEDLRAERWALTRWIGLIAANIGQARDQSELQAAHALALDREGVFIVQAWVAASDAARFEQFASRYRLALISADPGRGDKPPTLLDNPVPWAGGADLVRFYQTPGYFGWDPSPVVFFSFAFFFAMIMSDAGYAALLAVYLGLKWRGMGRTPTGLRFRLLVLTVILISLVWGVLCNSYFGYGFAPQSLAGKLKIIDMDNFGAMMRLSIFVGVAHLALANLIMAYQRRGKTTTLAALGWVAVAVGGFVFWIAADLQHGVARQIGLGLLLAGGLCVLFFSSERVVVKPVDWLWCILDGLKALTETTSLFGNVLSYLRLFALGMASVSLAMTFNRLAGQVHHALPGVGLLASLLILLAGHALNLLLCLLSGLVHGLRLNFIEFYNWSVSDEGYPFKAFAKKGAG